MMFGTMRTSLRTWLPIAIAWPAVGMLLNVLPAMRRASGGLPWLEPGLFLALLRWSEWLVLVPLVYLLARRSVVVQVFGAVPISLLHSLLFAMVSGAWRMSIARWPYDFLHDALIYTATLLALRAVMRRRPGCVAAELDVTREEPAALAAALEELQMWIARDAEQAEERVVDLADAMRARARREPVIVVDEHPHGRWFAAAIVTTALFGFLDAAALQVLVVIAMVMATSIIIVARRAERQQLAELRALRRQLDPHFLFNALSSVAALVVKDPPAAHEMVARLQHFYERSRVQGSAQLVSLAEELEFLQSYLAVEQVRFRDRLEVRIDVPEEARACRIPSLVLQPLVENAVRHGVAKRAERGVIDIVARVANHRLTLIVENDIDEIHNPAAEGIGLTNTRARLAHLHARIAVTAGDRYRVEIEVPCAS